MHAGDRDGVIDPRDRQLIARGVAQPGAVAQQQRADESGRIGREDGRDGRSQPLRKARGQQAERDGLGRLDMERPAAAGREEQTAADIVIAAAAQPPCAVVMRARPLSVSPGRMSASASSKYKTAVQLCPPSFSRTSQDWP